MSFLQLFDPNSSTFTYLIADDATHEAVLIDPVIEQVERDLRLIKEHGFKLKYALETHVHADHITASSAIKQATGAQTAVSRDCGAHGYDRSLEDGDVILFGREEILVIATPGHTPGSVSFLWRDRVFTGDALLIGGCGRTDFQKGDSKALYRSIIERLFALDDQVLVYPAHDYKGRRVSSIGEEKLFNPRIAGKTLEEFVAIMNNLHLPMPKHIQEAVPANLAGGAGFKERGQAADFRPLSPHSAQLRDISVQQLAGLHASGEIRILDVRTPGEFAGWRIPGSLNVPLDKLDPAKLMATVPPDSPVYCLCQTGTRSRLAAEKLRAGGYRQVVHVDGGTNAWEAAGFPLERGEGGVISMERQVRIAAGALVLLGLAAGVFIHPLAYGIAGFIGAGLFYSGVTNSCGMAKLLALMPWNKAPTNFSSRNRT